MSGYRLKQRPFGLTALAIVVLAGPAAAGAWAGAVASRIVSFRIVSSALISPIVDHVSKVLGSFLLALIPLALSALHLRRTKQAALNYQPWRLTPLAPRLERPG